MRYFDLLEQLQDLEEEQLDQQIMATVDDEFYRVIKLNIQDGQEQLSDGHPFLEIE